MRCRHRLAQRAFYGPEDLSWPREPHLGLGRMNVDVDVLRRQLHEQHHPCTAEPGTGLPQHPHDGSHQDAVADGSPVGKQGQRRPAGAAARRQERLHFDAAGPLRHAIDGSGRSPTVEVPESLHGIGRRRHLEQRSRSMLQRERHIRPCQRHRDNDLLRMAQLGFRRVQELASRGHVEEQVANLDRCAARPRLALDAEDSSALNRDPRPALCRVAAARQGEARDRCDRGDRLTAEAEGRNAIEVFGGRHLGGRVTLEGEEHIVPVHPAAVVTDADHGTPAVPHLHRDAPGAGVEAVLDQLLDHGGGTLDDFSRRDAIHDPVRKHSNPRHADMIQAQHPWGLRHPFARTRTPRSPC